MMQFGIFTVGDVTTDPTTGHTPSESERIQAMMAIALKAEEVGLDVFATGEHHNPPFVPSSPTNPSPGRAAKTTSTIARSAARSASVTRSSPEVLVSTVRSPLRKRRTSSEAAAATDRSAMTASSSSKPIPGSPSTHRGSSQHSATVATG